MLQHKIMVKRILIIVAFVALLGAQSAAAQTTAFSYQGKLTNGGNAATATYDMQFRLFGDPNAGQGTQQGPTITNPSVQATSGAFTVQLDFGAAVYASGADLYLEISVRPAGSVGGYTSLAPRPKITSTPYSIRTVSAAQADVALDSSKLGGTAANQFVLITDPRLTDDRNPLANSANYIQNTTSSQTSDFNITGNGNIGGNVGIGTTTPRAKLDVAGNAVQDLSAYGLVKATALVSVTQNQQGQVFVNILRCYNSVLNTAAGNCGFSPQGSGVTGGIRVDLNFGFTVNDRFLSLNEINLDGNAVTGANPYISQTTFTNSSTVRVATRGQGNFFIFVY